MEFQQHLFPSQLALFLQYMMGICWIFTYVILIYKGFKDKSCGMPFAALCGNITWEFLFSFVFPHTSPQLYINYIWFVLDMIILIQFIKFSRSDLPYPLSGKYFILTLIISLSTAFLLHSTFTLEFSDYLGVHSAYVLNMLMSLLFVMMLIKRDHLKGQSIYIAVFKLMGTCIASLLSYALFPSDVFLLFLYFATFFFDALYVFLLYKRSLN